MLTISDIKNDLFGQFDDTTKQSYVDYANSEVVDLAKFFGVAEADIETPWHLRLIRYAIHVALAEFAYDKGGFNNAEGFDEESDVYSILYNKAMYKKQEMHNKIAKVCFTGDAEDSVSRAPASVRLMRG